MAFLELAVIHPFPFGDYFGNTFFWIDDSLPYHKIEDYITIMSTNISTQIIDTLYF